MDLRRQLSLAPGSRRGFPSFGLPVLLLTILLVPARIRPEDPGAASESRAPDDLRTEYQSYERASAAGDLPRALGHARAALDLGLIRYGPDHPRVAILYNNLGGLYSRSGEYSRAEEYYRSALKIYLAGPEPEGPGAATVYNNLGRVCEKTARLDQAIRFYEQAIAITRKMKGETDPLLALRYNNLAGVLFRRGNDARALRIYRRALTINIERLGRDHPRTARVLANMAGVYRARNDLAKAESYYREALDIGRKHAGPDHPEVAFRAANLGGVMRARGDLVAALKLYRSAMTSFRRGGYRDEYLETLKNLALVQDEVPNYRHAAATLRTGINAVLAYRLQIGHGKSEFTRRHIDLFDRLFLLSMREGRHTGAFEADMLKRGLSISEGLALPAALKRGGVPADLRQAFLENRRRLGLLRSRRAAMIDAGKTREAAALMARILARERRQTELDARLIRDYSDYALLRAPYIPSPAEIREQLREGELLISYNFSQSRAMAFVAGKKRGLTVVPLGRRGRAASEVITNRIHNLHTFLAGAAADDSRMCPCFRIRTPGGEYRYWNQALPAWNESGRFVLEDGVVYLENRNPGPKRKRERVGIVEGDWFDGDEVPPIRRKLLKELYADLLGPILAKYPGARRLIIVPDGPAYYLPFNLLLDENDSMVLDRFRLKMIHSPAVWYRLRTGAPGRARLPVFGVGHAVYAAGHPDLAAETAGLSPGQMSVDSNRKQGPPGSLERTVWNNLPGTLDEIQDIARLAYGPDSRGQAHLLHGRAANRDRFLRINQAGKLKNYKILHFSLHGLFVDGNPNLNALVFSDPRFLVGAADTGAVAGNRPTSGDETSDRFLRLGDVKTLRLDSDLVVMSACETSLGRTSPGEGMVALPQGFLIAGSRNVMASLWAVDDSATRELMRFFYTYMLRDKKTPEEALRLAQIEVRKTRPDPFYWAAFELFGE